MSDYSEWNLLKIETNKKKSTTRIREGEIRWCHVGINIGNETFGKGKDFIRPVLVLKKFSADVFLGLPITSKKAHGSWFYEIWHDDTFQTVMLNQARLFDRKRLQNKLFEISENELLQIKLIYCNLIMQ